MENKESGEFWKLVLALVVAVLGVATYIHYFIDDCHSSRDNCMQSLALCKEAFDDLRTDYVNLGLNVVHTKNFVRCEE